MTKTSSLAIRLTRQGRSHRPHYRIIVAQRHRARDGRFIEVVGFYDPLPRQGDGLRRVGWNIDRIKYWLVNGAQPTERVAKLLGLGGILPIHPKTTAHYEEMRKALDPSKVKVLPSPPPLRKEGAGELTPTKKFSKPPYLFTMSAKDDIKPAKQYKILEPVSDVSEETNEVAKDDISLASLVERTAEFKSFLPYSKTSHSEAQDEDLDEHDSREMIKSENSSESNLIQNDSLAALFRTKNISFKPSALLKNRSIVSSGLPTPSKQDEDDEFFAKYAYSKETLSEAAPRFDSSSQIPNSSTSKKSF